ncbi:MAG: hypothetical protein WAQ28_15370 [Bacteroidia bacterium]|jgi:hypothetical protein
MSRFTYICDEVGQQTLAFTSINHLLTYLIHERKMPDELIEEIKLNFSEPAFAKLQAKTFFSKSHPVKIVRDYVMQTGKTSLY